MTTAKNNIVVRWGVGLLMTVLIAVLVIMWSFLIGIVRANTIECQNNAMGVLTNSKQFDRIDEKLNGMAQRSADQDEYLRENIERIGADLEKIREDLQDLRNRGVK